jgi:hypothetical protein
MKITTTKIFVGLALFVVLFVVFIWLTFGVFHIFQIGNVVWGGG